VHAVLFYKIDEVQKDALTKVFLFYGILLTADSLLYIAC